MATRVSPSRGAVDLALAFVVTAIVTAVLEVLARGGTVLALGVAVGSAAALGLVHALLWMAAIVGPARLRPRGRLVARAAIGLVVALGLASSLDAWDRLGTRNHMLALVAIAGSGIAGVLVAVVASWFGAVDDDGAPRWHHDSARRRALVAAALAIGSVVAWWIDRHAFAGLHSGAHSALRAAGLAGLAFAITVSVRPRVRAPWDRIALLLALLFATLPFALLPGRSGPELAAVWATPIADEGVAMLRRLTDTDGDGASAWLGQDDCAPWDPEIHPAAVEIPGNGIDDNCSEGDAAVVTAMRVDDVPVPQTLARRSVLLVTVETLRADRMGVYGYARDTTPALVARAAQARVFERAFTAGAWTSIAIPTLMRGVSARRLRWQPWRETTRGRLIAPDETVELVGDEQPMQVFMLPAPGGPPPLAWWLQRRGMATAAVVDDRFSELLDPSVGTAIGFDRFVDADEIRGRDPDDLVVDRAIEVLHELPAERPWFLWVHLFGPHSPNTVHEGVPSFGAGIGDGYDHEIRFVDAQIDRLLTAATARTPALVWVVTADHGEALLPDDRRHGFDLSAEVIRVPLLLGGDGIAAGRMDAPVSTLDLAPTILALTDTPPPPWLDGVSLLAAAPRERVLLVDTWHRDGNGGVLFDQVAATDGHIELIFERTKNAWSLADLADASRTPDQILATFDPAQWRATIRAYLEAGPLELEEPVQ